MLELFSDCGGVVELTTAKPSVKVTSPNYPQHYDTLKECVWYITVSKTKLKYVTSQGERVLRDMGFQYSKTNI